MLKSTINALSLTAALAFTALPLVAQDAAEGATWLELNSKDVIDWRQNPSIKNGEEVKDPNPGTNALDGKSDTYYEFNGDYGGGDAWILIDLGKDHLISSVETHWGKLGGAYTISYAPEGVAKVCPTDRNSVSTAIFTGSNEWEGWTKTNSIDRIIDGVPVSTWTTSGRTKARYIAICDATNPSGKPNLYEVRISAVEDEESVAASIAFKDYRNLVPVGYSQNIEAQVFDQYGDLMPAAAITYTCGGELHTGPWQFAKPGDYTITATVKGAEDKEISATATVSVYAPVPTSVRFKDHAKITQAFRSVEINADVYDNNGWLMADKAADIVYTCLETGAVQTDDHDWWGDKVGNYTIEASYKFKENEEDAEYKTISAQTSFVVNTEGGRLNPANSEEVVSGIYFGNDSYDVFLKNNSGENGKFITEDKDGVVSPINPLTASDGNAIRWYWDETACYKDGEGYKPLRINFKDETGLTLQYLALRWEAAAPEAYEVSVVQVGSESPIKIFNLAERKFRGAFNPQDEIYNAEHYNNVFGTASDSENESEPVVRFARRYAPEEGITATDNVSVNDVPKATMSNVGGLIIKPTKTNSQEPAWGMKLTGLDIYAVDSNNVPTVIKVVDSDNADAPVEYYTLQGVKVAEPSAAGIYIRRQGSNATKILVK